jgi:5-methyltetrahydrofolate--homocysteine methyltransferase
LYADARRMLKQIVRERWLTARGVIGLFPANSVDDDDVEIYTDESRTQVLTRLHFLRQQKGKPAGQPHTALADFIAPKSSGKRDYVGAFAVTAGVGIEQHIERFEKTHDDYSSIMLKVLADRFAEAFAERLHERVKATLWQLLDPTANAGITLTESFAMYPTAAVSGWYFSHPGSHYFPLGKIDLDQVQNYAARKKMSLEEAQRWLAPSLGYDADADADAA